MLKVLFNGYVQLFSQFKDYDNSLLYGGQGLFLTYHLVMIFYAVRFIKWFNQLFNA